MTADKPFQRGFKTRAERLALEIRSQLSLSALDRIDPRQLAIHLGFCVVSIGELAHWGAPQESIDHFLSGATDEFSAMTVSDGVNHIIIENPRHSSRRRVSSLAHELAHVLLKHQPGPAFGTGGCRVWGREAEAEADWLAGVLLVPREAALACARSGESLETAANRMGVSIALMRWRINITGAKAQAQHERKASSPLSTKTETPRVAVRRH